MRIIIKNLIPKEPEGERESLRKVTSGTLKWTPKGWEVGGCVWLSDKNLDFIPYRFYRVQREFCIGYNNITSLEGSPQFVGEGFYAFNNKLTSLIGSPEEVGGDFFLNNNCLLTSIKGISRKIGGDLTLLGNKLLTSLEGFPEAVGGNLYLRGTSIPYMERIPGLRGRIIWD